MVLSRKTGLVSNQFHVKFDPLFHSVEQDIFDSQWQNKAGFTKKEPKPKNPTRTSKKRVVSFTTPPAQTADMFGTNNQIINSEGAMEAPMQEAEGVLDTQDKQDKRKIPKRRLQSTLKSSQVKMRK